MFNAITELFLSEYFVLTASVGRFAADSRDLFTRLSKIFLIDKAEADELFELCDKEAVREIVTEQDYLRHQRMQHYFALTGEKSASDCNVDELIRVKGNALANASKQKLHFDPHASRNAEYASLLTAASGGLVSAIKILGFMQCEGIVLEQNVKAGLKNLTKAANWNDCVGTLALLYYTDFNRSYNMSRLRMIVDGTPFEDLFRRALKAYGAVVTDSISEVRLLERAFASAKLNRSVYNPVSARILYGDVLTLKDKEQAMFSTDTGKLGLLSDLPLKLSESRITAVDVVGISDAVLFRPIEHRRVITALGNADLRTCEQYRPLCLASDSPYVLNMYARSIRSQDEDCRYEVINVANLTGYDLEPSVNNVFVRCIDEDVDNRFLMFFVGNVPDKVLDYVKNFLVTSRRAKFHLNTPNVTLNLSSVLPVCFCDKRNARLLEDILDVVYLADVSDAELPQAVADVMASKAELYGVDITLQGTAYDVFADCNVDKAERLIDAVVRNHRRDGKTIVLTRSLVAEYAFGGNSKRIGFGE